MESGWGIVEMRMAEMGGRQGTNDVLKMGESQYAPMSLIPLHGQSSACHRATASMSLQCAVMGLSSLPRTQDPARFCVRYV